MAAEEGKRFRTLEGPYGTIEAILETVIPLTGLFFIFDVFSYFFNSSLYSQQYLGIFLGLIMALLFLKIPVPAKVLNNVVPWYDWIFALLSLVSGIYVLIFYPQLAITMGIVTSSKVVFGIIAGLLILEGTRRVAGWPLVIVIIFFIGYARFGYLLPGLGTQKATWGRLINQLYLGSEAIYGVALRISSLVVFTFILYAHALFGTGGADFLFKVSEALMGRFRGGPAKVSIIASCFFGTLSGSAVANVAGTGTITIPLMKRAGFPAYYASAVEAVASTGGTITPPVMGAAAFLIAEFVGVPYSQVVLVAVIPALLYYLSLFIQVDLNSSKEQRRGLPPDEKAGSFPKLLFSGWAYMLSLFVLVYCLFVLYLRPEVSVLYALAALLVLITFSKNTRRGLTDLINILRSTSRGLLEITVICAAAGIIIGVVNYTGLGFSLSRLLTSTAGDNLFILAVVAALVSIILGMGVPGLVSYMVLAVLVAPALIQLGIQPLLAHFFIFYFGLFSFITPPFCLAVYTAASIGQANMLKTSLAAMKLALPGFVVPFIFLYNPSLVFLGDAGDIAVSIIGAIFSVIAVSIVLENYLLQKLGWANRVLFTIAAICLIYPGLWSLRLAGAVIFLTLIIYNCFIKPKVKESSAGAAN